MSHFRLLSAVAILAATMASPVMAQEVIWEPGYCAFFYPNANCQNKGPGNPYTDSNYQRSRGSYASTVSGPPGTCARYRSYDPASGTYIGRNGRRIACQ